jgi:hypothetical protein
MDISLFGQLLLAAGAGWLCALVSSPRWAITLALASALLLAFGWYWFESSNCTGARCQEYIAWAPFAVSRNAGATFPGVLIAFLVTRSMRRDREHY